MTKEFKLNLGKKDTCQCLILKYNGNPKQEYEVMSETTFEAPVLAIGWESLKSYLQTRDFIINVLKIRADEKHLGSNQRAELEKIVAEHNELMEKNLPKKDYSLAYIY